MRIDLRKQCGAEALGTFGLVFAGTGAIVINSVSGGSVTHVGIAITFGLVVMAMIYAVGGISGAHINPSVTVALWAGRQFPGNRVLPYFTSQLVGALLASALLHSLFPQSATLGETLPAGTATQSLVLEVVLTFFLMLVILGVCNGPTATRPFAGVAIGGTVGLEAMFAGPICGASMNPARSLAPAIVGGQLEHVWLYVVGPHVGALLAVAAWAFIGRRGVGDDGEEEA